MNKPSCSKVIGAQGEAIMAGSPRRRRLSNKVDSAALGNALVAFAFLSAVLATSFPAAAASATLRLTLNERPVSVDIHVPAAPTQDAVVLVHGFTRTRATMAGHAAALAQAGLLAVAPDLPYGLSAQDNAQALAELVAILRQGSQGGGVPHAPVARVVLVGYSVGALTALLAATSPGVVGYVALDPIDYPGGEGLFAAYRLNVPAVLVHGPPSLCNVFRIAARWAAVLPALVADRSIADAGHCDFESPTDRGCTWFCGAADPLRQGKVSAALLEAVADLLARGATAQGGAAGN